MTINSINDLEGQKHCISLKHLQLETARWEDDVILFKQRTEKGFPPAIGTRNRMDRGIAKCGVGLEMSRNG